MVLDRPRTVDVFLTQKEMQDGMKATATACLKVDPTLLQPASCVSKPGISSRKIFGGARPHTAGPSRSDAAQDADAMVALFYGKQHNTASASSYGAQYGADLLSSANPNTFTSTKLANQLKAAHSKQTPQLLDDEHALERTLRTPSMLAAQQKQAYMNGGSQQMQRPKTSPAGGARASVPSSPKHPRASLASGKARERASHAGSMAGGGLSAQKSSAALSQQDEEEYEPDRRPQSAAFRTTTRDQAQRIGSKFVYAGKDAPGPGQYTPKYRHQDKDTHAFDMAKTPYWGPSPETLAARERVAAEQAARAQATSSVSPPRIRQQREAERAAAGSPTGSPGKGRGQLGRSKSMYEGGERVEHDAAGAANTGHPETSRLFEGAHSVHHRSPTRPGTAAFKVVPRPSPSMATTAGHLYGAYFKEGYERLTKRSARPASAFEHQKPRPEPHNVTEAGELGPGAYAHSSPVTRQATMGPPTWTGKHVTSGHSSLSKVRNFDHDTSRPPMGSTRTTSPPKSARVQARNAHLVSGGRPATAPAGRHGQHGGGGAGAGMRAMSAHPSQRQHQHQHPQQHPQQGYYGANAPTSSYWPDEPQFEQLVAINALQERMAAEHAAHAASQVRPVAPLRQVAAMQAAQQQQLQQQQQQQQQRYEEGGEEGEGGLDDSGHQQHDDQGAQQHQHQQHHHHYGGSGSAPGSRSASPSGRMQYAYGGTPLEPGVVPLTYLNVDSLEKYSSTGPSKRVQGGAFSPAKREDIVKGMRCMADGKVTPPAAVKVMKGIDLMYSPNFMVEGHRRRDPVVTLPPNRTALSRRWVETAATAYM